MESMILKDREWQVKNASEAIHLLEGYSSVKSAEWVNTTSSAGDWEGYIVQKINGRNYLIIFWQENNWPHEGFTLHTNPTPICSWVGDISKEEIYNILEEQIQ